MIDVSVLIVTWNNADEIKNCVESILSNSKNLTTELIIIDNNSSDDTFSIINKLDYPRIETYKNKTNTGYTKAINQAVKYSSGKNIFLLNPDTILRENCMSVLNNFLNEDEDYGACAPLMMNEDGSIQNSLRNFPDYLSMLWEFSLLAYIFPKSRLFGKWKMKYFTYDNDTDVEQPMAAALMVKKSVIEDVNKMDERFEMFFNDVDLCKKIIDSGKKIRFITSAKVVHAHGASIYKDRIRMIKIWNNDIIEYFRKYHNNPVLLLWLKINLKISEILRILYYKIKH